MRLERVIAKDARRATEQVLATFGPDALIVSNQRVNGMTEIVVAIETEDEVEAPAARESTPTARVFAPRADQEFGRSLIESLRAPAAGERQPTPRDRSAARAEPTRTAADVRSESTDTAEEIPPFLRNLASPPRAISERAAGTQSNSIAAQSDTDDRLTEQSAPLQRSRRDMGAHQPVEEDRAEPTITQTSVPARQRSLHTDREPDVAALEMPLASEEADESLDAMRARELVDLVRAELSSMRQEIALSRQVESFPPGGALNPALQPLAGALTAAGAPAGLRTLLLDQVRDCTDLHEAVDRMKRELSSNLAKLERPEDFEGVHVIAGPSGAGKTQMLCRIASQHVARQGADSVAIISFSDNRIGAWTQLQMLAARLGVECFRVSGSELLGPMLSELSTRRLVLVDTPGTGASDKLDSIRRCAPKALFNLVMPADASVSGISRFVPDAPVAWHSLMVSKLDESACAWPLIQALCNHPIPLSVGSADAAAEAPASALMPADLIRHAFEQLDLPAKPAARARSGSRAAAPKRTTRDTRHAV